MSSRRKCPQHIGDRQQGVWGQNSNTLTALTEPVRNIVPNLVYAASGHEVKTVIVAGKVLVRDGVVLAADEDAVRAQAQVQAEALSRRVAADPVH